MKKSTILIILILLLGAFLRLYRTPDLLGFWYDQGRDALVVWDIWKQGKLTLIGPTTGIEGIFLGPFYYYLLTPLYILGRGNPVVPAAGLVFFNLTAMGLLYLMARKHFSPRAGILAVFLMAVSYHLASSHRWLSNPTPLPLFSVLSVWALLNIVSAQKRLVNWVVLGLSVGLGLHLEAASAVFFIPAVLIALFIFRRQVDWNPSRILLGFAGFFLTLVPQILFDFRHEHILFDSFYRFLVSDKSFSPQWQDLFFSRIRFFFTAFSEKFFLFLPMQVLFLMSLAIMVKKLGRHLFTTPFRVILVWILTPVAGLLFYSGNKGYVWGYYLTGVYPFVALAVAVIFCQAFRRSQGAALLVIFLLFAISLDNGLMFKKLFVRRVPGYITLNQSLSAVDWSYTDSAGRPFNYDVYVPPMIYSAYDYLFLWRGTYHFYRLPEAKLVTRLYTIFEPDDGHQTLLDAWMARQASIGSIEETRHFGNITAQRRHRFSIDEQK